MRDKVNPRLFRAHEAWPHRRFLVPVRRLSVSLIASEYRADTSAKNLIQRDPTCSWVRTSH
jgi:hypothetical protein